MRARDCIEVNISRSSGISFATAGGRTSQESVPLVESHQHAALLLDVVHGEARAIAVTPRGADHGRQELLASHLADAREVVLQHALLGGDLRRGIDVLHGAAAAGAEVAASRDHALGALAQHPGDGAQVEVAAAAALREDDPLAGDAAVDERDLALDVRDSDPFVVYRLDEGFVGGAHWHSGLGIENTWRWICFVTAIPSRV